ncbi:hypothetical protein ES702_07517 [subsurface metagenome]
MAIRKLGPAGSEITLPSIAIALPVVISKKIERAEMSDGSARWAFFKKYRGWEISFPNITRSELDDLIALRALNQILRWQNNDESATWYDVVITDFNYNTADPISPTVYYFASMTLEEAV